MDSKIGAKLLLFYYIRKRIDMLCSIKVRTSIAYFSYFQAVTFYKDKKKVRKKFAYVEKIL